MTRAAPVVLSAGARHPEDGVGVVVIGGLPRSGPERALYLHTDLEGRFRCTCLCILVAVAPSAGGSGRGLHPLLVARTAVLTDDFRGAPALVVLAVSLVEGGKRA